MRPDGQVPGVSPFGAIKGMTIGPRPPPKSLRSGGARPKKVTVITIPDEMYGGAKEAQQIVKKSVKQGKDFVEYETDIAVEDLIGGSDPTVSVRKGAEGEEGASIIPRSISEFDQHTFQNAPAHKAAERWKKGLLLQELLDEEESEKSGISRLYSVEEANSRREKERREKRLKELASRYNSYDTIVEERERISRANRAKRKAMRERRKKPWRGLQDVSEQTSRELLPEEKLEILKRQAEALQKKKEVLIEEGKKMMARLIPGMAAVKRRETLAPTEDMDFGLGMFDGKQPYGAGMAVTKQTYGLGVHVSKQPGVRPKSGHKPATRKVSKDFGPRDITPAAAYAKIAAKEKEAVLPEPKRITKQKQVARELVMQVERERTKRMKEERKAVILAATREIMESHVPQVLGQIPLSIHKAPDLFIQARKAPDLFLTKTIFGMSLN